MNEAELYNRIEHFIKTIDFVSYAMTVSSLALAIVSILLSLYFFRSGYRTNKETTDLLQKTEQQISFLKELFDKMIDTSFGLIVRQSDAMQEKLFTSIGYTETKKVINYETEIIAFIAKNRKTNMEEIYQSYPFLDKQEINGIVDTFEKRELIEKTGLDVYFREKYNKKISSSEENNTNL